MESELAILAAVLAAILLIAIPTLVFGVAPVPTSTKVLRVMLDVLPDDFEGTILELGSGWGTLAFALARRFPRCPVLAFEISPLPWLFSCARQLLAPAPNLSIRRSIFQRAPLMEARLVVCYLNTRAMTNLKPRFEAELQPGCLVLSNTFAVAGWQPVSVLIADDLFSTRIYLYRVSVPLVEEPDETPPPHEESPDDPHTPHAAWGGCYRRNGEIAQRTSDARLTAA